MSRTEQIMARVEEEKGLTLMPEDIIHNLQVNLQSLARENGRLEERVRSLEADNALLRDSIINSFTSDWATPGLAR